MIKEGTIIEFKSGNQFEVTRVWHKNIVDLKAVQPFYPSTPDSYQVCHAIRLKNFKIVSSNGSMIEAQRR